MDSFEEKRKKKATVLAHSWQKDAFSAIVYYQFSSKRELGS